MAQRPWNPILQHIRSLAARHDSPTCDAELLRQFVAHHDETAFESLLRRHGPMVLRVARRTVGNETDAEDVFQATFLLLARRAGNIRKRESVASWLHGVAHRLALSARGKCVRRQEREREAAAARAVESPPESAWSGLEETLHEVLAQLPEKYRTPLIYCYLEGWTQEEVARQLGKPLGTVRSWLARGREMLRKRLVRRGISLSTEGASAALLASACATAEAVPPTLRIATSQAAQLFAGGGKTMTMISPAVAELVKKGMTAILVAKLKSGAPWVLALTLLAAGSGWAAHRTFSAKAPEANETAEKAGKQQAVAEDRPRTDAFGDPLPPGAVARLGSVRFCHEDHLKQFALSPDGRTLAATAGKSVAFWDIATGRLTQRLTFRWDMFCLAFAPDGKSLAVAGEDCIVYLFDSASGKELRRFVGHQVGKDQHFRGIYQAFFTPDGRTLLTQGSDEKVRFWDTRSGKELRQIDAQKWDFWKLSVDGKLLAVTKAGAEKMLHVLDAATGKEVRQLNHSDTAGVMAFSPDGKTLALASGTTGTVRQPGRITLWEPESGKELGTLVSHSDAVYALAFSADGKRLASAGDGKTLRLWDLASQKEIREPLHLLTPVHGLAFSRDGKTLISQGFGNHLRLWDVATGRERFPVQGPSGAISAIAYSPDGKMVASASSDKFWLWAPASGKVLRTLETQEGNGTALSFSVSGKSLIYGSDTLRFLDPMTGKEQKSFRTGNGWIERVALSPDGGIMAVWGTATSRQIHLLHAGTGAKLRTIEVPCEQPGVIAIQLSLRFSPDSKTLYACNGNHLSILRWDAAAGKALPLIGKHDGGLNDIAVSPDGRSVAVASMGGSVYLWETATGQNRLVSKDAGLADAVAFSPDGRLLAVVNGGNSTLLRGNEVIPQGIETREQVRLIRIADGKVIHRFTGHLGGIWSLSFSPDGHTLASGGLDSTVLVWDMTKLRRDAVKDTAPLTPEKLGELWKGLLDTAAEANECMWTLIGAPGQAVPFLSEKLKPIAALDAERFARLLKKLESDQFSEREEATQELKKLGDAIEPALRKALQEKVPLETRRRFQALLDDLEGAEHLRSLRAIEVLERIGDKPARDLPRRLSEGAAGAWLTEEARISLRRLQR
jgi:RNA polymerase sigma factor (sigma-70 family)